jgi:hypothetical protein
VLKQIGTGAALENCRALINQINAGLSAEEPFVNVSSAAELLSYLECAASALKKARTTPAEAWVDKNPFQLSLALTTPRLRTLHLVRGDWQRARGRRRLQLASAPLPLDIIILPTGSPGPGPSFAHCRSDPGSAASRSKAVARASIQAAAE